MLYRPELLDALEALEASAWQGTVWRHMFSEYPPSRENTRGSRWNPPGTAAIYTSLAREIAVAEGNYMVNLQPLRPRASRSVYEVSVELSRVVDLSNQEGLDTIGLSQQDLTSHDFTACQEVGGAVAWLGNDGLLVPSARTSGLNLVIYPGALSPDAEFQVLRREVLEEADGG